MINAIYDIFLPWTVVMHVTKKGRVPEILSLQKQKRMVTNTQTEKLQGR